MNISLSSGRPNTYLFLFVFWFGDFFFTPRNSSAFYFLLAFYSLCIFQNLFGKPFMTTSDHTAWLCARLSSGSRLGSFVPQLVFPTVVEASKVLSKLSCTLPSLQSMGSHLPPSLVNSPFVNFFETSLAKSYQVCASADPCMPTDASPCPCKGKRKYSESWQRQGSNALASITIRIKFNCVINSRL